MNSTRKEIWKRLLSSERLGADSTAEESLEGRSEFDRDYDRIIFSSPFRRLQDKTQVFPLSPSDYIRTRLTHSLEVSCVGRSLGQMAGRFLADQGLLDDINVTYADIGTIVAAACVAHDIGNPPFGHSGEAAIQQWAKSKFNALTKSETPNGSPNLAKLIKSRAQREDFCQFEGNAQSFRIFTKLQGKERRGGLRLTLATLGALSKYPRPSVIDPKLAKAKDVSLKKFGYFQDELSLAVEAYRKVGMKESAPGVFSRHPLSFLMEAADDICYAIVDIEDAHQLKLISYSEIEAILVSISAGAGEGIRRDELNDTTKVHKLRAAAINSLTLDCINVFKDHLEEIETGKFKKSLVNESRHIEEYKRLKQLAREKVYSNERVLTVEYAGYHTIGGLLEMYYSAMLAENPGSSDEKLRKLFPAYHSKSVQEAKDRKERNESLTPYQKLLMVTDYISGMTDSFAVDLYQKLSGIKLPS